MRTRTADTPKSGATKRTPPQKKDAAAADKTPETTPKSTARTTKASRGKQPAASKASTTPVAATPDPKPETKVEEAETPAPAPAPVGEKKLASAAKTPEKKPSAKKSPLPSKAAASKANGPPKVESAQEEPPPEVNPEEKEEEVKKEEEKNQDATESKPEAASDVKEELHVENKDEAAQEEEEEELMEEVAAEEGFAEPGDEELAAADEIGEGDAGDAVPEGEEVGAEHHNQEEGAGVEVDEQMEILDMAKARKIKKEHEIFVGGLNRDATEEDVKKEFEKVGEVVEVRILKDFTTDKNKGFAFVKFATKEQAAKALLELKNPSIRGKRCGIAPSEDNDTLFLGNICNTWTKEAIRRKLKDYGIDAVVSITLVPDTQNEGLSRGFAFLEFPCHADAMVAYKRLQKPDVIFGHPERTAKVAFAEPLREPDPEVMAQVKSVFVDGLPPYWDEDRVKEQFKGYGEIERVVLARNMLTAKRKDFGFVNFTTHEAALACIEGVNNTELGDGKSKMKARARLANPLPKSQVVKGGMSGGFLIGHSGIGGYPRFGRGFGRGRFPSHRAGQGGRGFVPRGRGRGRFPFAAENDFETSYSEFRGGWRPFGPRGGRRMSTSAWRGDFDRGRGKVFPSRRQPFPPEENFGGPFGPRHISEDPYFYGDGGGQGIKRPFSMMEHERGYMDFGSRIRPRYDHPDPMSGATSYRDSLGMTGLYSRDYYGPDYGAGTNSSLYGGEPSGSGYYY